MNGSLRLTACLLMAFGLVSPAAPSLGEDQPPLRTIDLDLDFTLADINDNSLRWSLGREEHAKVPYALLMLSGHASRHVSYRIELNGVNDSMRPEPFTPSDKTPFFFPNRVEAGYGITSHPEGQYKVDVYKNTGWDPYLVEHSLRRAFVDVHRSDRRLGLVVGRFFPAMGFQIEDGRWFTARDLTHIQLIDTQVDAGLQAYYRFGKDDGRHGEVSIAGITGNGNPYHDYVYFDFTRQISEDTNSAKAFVGAARLFPLRGLEVALSASFNYVGSRIEGDTTLQRSKHYDNKLIGGVRWRPSFFERVQVFGEVARYKWGLRDSSAELLPGPPVTSPILKNGYYVGADLGWPLPGKKGTVGAVVLFEELDRDDALIDWMAARNNLHGVYRGAKERSTILKLYAEMGPVTAFAFYNDLDNPFPQASAIVPLTGPFAFQGPGNRKLGLGIRFKLRAWSAASSGM